MVEANRPLPDPPPRPIGSGGHVLPDLELPDRSAVVRLFGSHDFFRLWIAQVVSALGDWIGFLAIVVVADRVGGSSSGAAISLVMTARMVPGFFLAPVAGVLVDRLNRKHLMVICDLSRAAVLMTVPFIDTLWALVVASLLLEVATLLWSPAKEASVPNLVPAAQLTAANSLSLVAAYGTMPVATLIFATLAKLAERLAEFDVLSTLRVNQESLALVVDAGTFLLSALIISSVVLTRTPTTPVAGVGDLGVDDTVTEAGRRLRLDLRGTREELREGWRFMLSNPVVRAVSLAIGTGLIGGGMLLPLGKAFSRNVVNAGDAGYGLLLTALGTGMAVGVTVLSAAQRRLPKETVFSFAVMGSGVALLVGASVSSLTPALVFVGVLGLCAGAVYVLGFTILHESVADEFRGRIFSSLYTLVRLCLLVSFTLGPLLADRLDSLADHVAGGTIALGGVEVVLSGVRLSLWFAALIILFAGAWATMTLRNIAHVGGEATRQDEPTPGGEPS